MEIKSSYDDLAKVGKKYYKDTGFCAVIAIATACKISFGKARAMCKKLGRPDRKGTPLPIIGEVIRRRGYRAKPLTTFDLNTKGGWTWYTDRSDWEYVGHHLKTMPNKLPKGTYMILVRNHILTMVDGKINDWSEGRSLRVQRVWEITKQEITM